MDPEPTAPPPLPRSESGLENYHRAADTIGLIPSLRWKDNLIQAVVVVSATAAGAAVGGLVWRDWIAAAMSAAAGMILSAFLSGLVLMVLGWLRAAKRR